MGTSSFFCCRSASHRVFTVSLGWRAPGSSRRREALENLSAVPCFQPSTSPAPRLPESGFRDFAWPRALPLLDYLASSVIQKVDPEECQQGRECPLLARSAGWAPACPSCAEGKARSHSSPLLAVQRLWLDCPRPPLCSLMDRPGNTGCQAIDVRGILSYFHP